MIIELITTAGTGKNLCLVHFDLIKDKVPSVVRMCELLDRKLPNYEICAVINGMPCPTNSLPKITLVNSDNEILMSVIKKISKNPEPGAFISLTGPEMHAFHEALKTGDYVQI